MTPATANLISCNASGARVPSSPILDNKDPDATSLFEPAALLRQARRQKGLPVADVPRLCVLDPDGDIVRRLQHSAEATRAADWPCYHTDLYRFRLAGETAGIVACAVGAPFAVLVAEELFACGCRTLISLTSAGQIVPAGRPPYFVIIDRALRDEGTSYHYAAPAEFAEADPGIVAAAMQALTDAGLRAYVGSSWTTDAPFRETAAAVAAARARGVLAVEMEAAALYTFARKRNQAVLCLAHVTNTMGLSDLDFEKGEADGTTAALTMLEALAKGIEQA
jgi:uridine phosphorylase